MRRLIAGIAATVLFVGCDTRGRFDGVAVDPPRAMDPVAFTLPDRSTFTLGPVANGATVVFFGYTHCPDICPTTLADWKRVKARLGPDAERVRFVFVSVDPERDTPAVALRYARQFDSTFVGLAGDAPTTARALERYGVAAARESGSAASGYLVSHSSQQFLLDAGGALVALYPFGTRWEALATDLERVLP